MKKIYEEGFRITGMQATDIDHTLDDTIIPMLWKTFTGSTWSLLEGKENELGIVAVSFNRTETTHDYMIGIVSGQKFGLPEFGVPSTTFAKFKIHGHMPESRNQLYNQVKSTFDLAGTKSSESFVLEIYSKPIEPDVMDLELWIPVG